MSQLFQDDGPARTGQKVCLATTAYDNPDASYTYALQSSREALHAAGIQTAYYLLQGNCHVDDARNRIVQEFLLSDCDDLVFLDADVSWRSGDLVRLCRHDVDLVGGVYPYRSAMSRIDMPVRMFPGVVEPNADGLIAVEGLPTGFMRIRRVVLETLARTAPSHWNKDDRRSRVPILFERTLDEEIRWGGDLNFCNKWRRAGGTVHADYELVLGHVAKTVVKDSLGATLRRASRVTLRHIANKIRAGTETLSDYTEARNYVSNAYGALEDVLAVSVKMAREATGPIIETGSGLTTILMAAATEQTVYCLEHSRLYAEHLRQMVEESGVNGIGLCECPIKDGWYDVAGKTLPASYSFGLNDGPPRTIGSRTGFMTHFGDRVQSIICDDADDPEYLLYLTAWAGENDFSLLTIPPRTALLSKEPQWRQRATLSPAA